MLVPGSDARSMALDPQNRFVFVANHGSNDVAGFSVDTSSGLLTTLGANVPAGGAPSAILMDPTGRFVYVANSNTNDVWSYAIPPGATGLVQTGAAPAGINPTALAIDPSGRTLFVANQGSNNVSIFTLDPNTGSPTPS